MAPHGPLYVRREPGPTTFGLRIEENHCNPAMNCHGGMLATFADIALGLGGFEQAGVEGFFITVTLQTDFLAPAPLGAWLECRPELLRRTRTLIFMQGVFTADAWPVLRASGVFQLPRVPTPGTA